MYNLVIFLASITQQGYADYVADLWGSFYATCCGVIGMIVFVIGVAGLWRIFTKAGEKGWPAIIPIYNLWVLMRVVGRPGWWIILFLIPIVQIIVHIIVSIELSKSFDKDFGYALGIFLFPYFFYFILGFSDAKYFGPGGPAAS